MAETLHKNRIANWHHESPTAIGGDYLTEDQAAALRAFIERLANTPCKVVVQRSAPLDAKRSR